ncbi:MAG: substrate-binding domain-containing protein [Oscillospiraceae bacterium]|nr:substrate-binding domain-containing protein [Oscillospiraceae bacterium]
MQKRIGIIMSKVYKEINRQQLCGILEEAYARGFSTCVFTLTEESSDAAITTGEQNLFRAINFSLLDGVVFLTYTFSSIEYRDYIQRFLQENCPLPVVRIGMETTPFANVWYNDREELREVTRHLIQEHGCRDLICLTGQDFQSVSHERLAGFLDAVQEAGLTCPEENRIFGDFWIYSAQTLAREIADGIRPKPDAVVCCNDTMAIALCDALRELGIIVPDDLLVTGYDGALEAEMHSPPVTTFQTSWRQLGRNAFTLLYTRMTGEETKPRCIEKGTLLCRESCGCHSKMGRNPQKEMSFQKMEDAYLDSNLSTRLLSCNNLDSFVRMMFDNMFFFAIPEYYDKEAFCLCLCEGWDRGSLPDHSYQDYRVNGYSDKMTVMSYTGAHYTFPLSDMLPPEFVRQEQVTTTFFTAAHFQDRCFGYALLQYRGIVDGFTAHYLHFCREINNGLEFLRVQNALRSLAYHNLLTQVRDTMTGLYNLKSLPHLWGDYLHNVQCTGERAFWVALSITGLYRLTESHGSLVKDKLLVAFSEQIQNACSHGEKCLRAGEGDFLILGSEPETSHYHNLLVQNIREQFEQYQKTLGQSHLPLQYAVASEERMPHNPEDAEKAAIILLSKAKASQPSYSEQLHYTDLAELRRSIYKNPERDWSLGMCAELLNISSSYFHRIYQKAFGVSCASDIHRSKLEHAKFLLLHTSDTLQEIARKCGYDYSHFMRTFKKEFGMTPTEYRRGKTDV